MSEKTRDVVERANEYLVTFQNLPLSDYGILGSLIRDLRDEVLRLRGSG